MDAGFTIFRCDDQPQPRIKYKNADSKDWRTHDRFTTKAERDRAFKNLMNMSFAIND